VLVTAWPASGVTASLTHVLVQQHPDQQRQQIAPEHFVGRAS
jgi:hypothetical protein